MAAMALFTSGYIPLLDILDLLVSAFIHEIAAIFVKRPRGARGAKPAIREVDATPLIVYVADEAIVIGEGSRRALHDV